MKTWTTPWGTVQLGRQPYDSDPALQAWNAADALLARAALAENQTPGRLHVVYNDPFGALATLLVKNRRPVAQVTDSSLTQRCTLWNLEANGLSDESLLLLDSLTLPPPPQRVSDVPVVLYRLPKSHALLEFQLHQIRSFLPPGAVVTAAAMVKDVHTTTLELFERILGPTETTLAETKARMIRCTLADKPATPSPYPSGWTIPTLDWKVVSHASVFSRETLDGGTRLLLRNFPKIGFGPRTVIDLGCGTGILGLAAAIRAPESQVYCVDESFMAVWSARETFRANELGGRGFFLAGDGLEDFEKQSADVVLCNPPFHYQNAQTLEIALGLFDQARQVLKPDGELWVVANKHLGHHKSLADRFSAVKTVALDERFIVLRARP